MSMRDKISNALKTAMKARDTERLAALRLINAAIKDRDIVARGEGAPEVSDAEIITVLTRMVKQRRESARAYEEAARLDLAEKETAEIAVIEDFLPRQMSDDEIAAAVETAVTETNAASVRDIGRVMGVLKNPPCGRDGFCQGRSSDQGPPWLSRSLFCKTRPIVRHLPAMRGRCWAFTAPALARMALLCPLALMARGSTGLRKNCM